MNPEAVCLLCNVNVQGKLKWSCILFQYPILFMGNPELKKTGFFLAHGWYDKTQPCIRWKFSTLLVSQTITISWQWNSLVGTVILFIYFVMFFFFFSTVLYLCVLFFVPFFFTVVIVGTFFFSFCIFFTVLYLWIFSFYLFFLFFLSFFFFPLSCISRMFLFVLFFICFFFCILCCICEYFFLGLISPYCIASQPPTLSGNQTCHS